MHRILPRGKLAHVGTELAIRPEASLLRKLVRGTKVAWAFGRSLVELLVQRPKTRPARAAWLTRLCRRVLFAVELTWTVSGPIPERGAVITNHLTYLDIFLHAAMRPCVFVSAIEIRRLPLLGWMSMMAGTVYVTRGRGSTAAEAASGMAQGFQDHLPVVFFPEGQTGVGDEPVLPLRGGLLGAALIDGEIITPGFLQYELSTADQAAGRTTREDVHWGTQTLSAHLWNFLGLQPLHAEVRFAAEPIAFSPQALANRKIAAKEARMALLKLSGS